MNDEQVFTRDRSSGKLHRRYRTPDGSLASVEADNLDDAGVYDIVDASVVEAADQGQLCERCFPPAVQT